MTPAKVDFAMRSPVLPLALAAAVVVLAGCVGEVATDAPAPSSVEDGDAAPDPWKGRDEVRLVNDHVGEFATIIWGVCFPGETEVDRTEKRVYEGTDHLTFALSVDDQYTGLQVGYRLGDAEIEWFPVVNGGETDSWDVEVPPDGFEFDDTLWSFHISADVRGAEDHCPDPSSSTGAGHGAHEFTVDAYRG